MKKRKRVDIQMIDVKGKSSNIEYVGWKGIRPHILTFWKNRSMLFIEFYGSRIYKYDGISRKLFRRFMDAPSLGKFFHEKIKDKYLFQKIDTVVWNNNN